MRLFGLDITRRTSPENPTTSLSNPASWLTDLFTGGPTDAGVPVNEDTALGLSAVWGCVRVLAETIGMLPIGVFEKTGSGREARPDHPGHLLMALAPSPDMPPMVFRETLQSHMAMWGNGYAAIVRKGSGEPVELIPLLPDRTRPERRGLEIRYITTLADGHNVALRQENVLHAPGLGFDGLVGYSVIAKHRQTLGLTMAAQKFGAKFFDNGASLKGVLETDNKLDEHAQKRLKESFGSVYAGVGNAHKTAVLEQGLHYKTIGIPPDDAQFLETRRFQVEEIARIFRVPPHVIGHLEKATFNNIEQLGQEFLMFAILPWLVRWEQELNRKLLLPSEHGRLFFKFNFNGLLRGDIKSRFEAYNMARNMGVMSANDIRDLEDMNRLENGGDLYIIPMNMQAQTDTLQADSVAHSPAYANRHLPIVLSAVERVVRKEHSALVRAFAKYGATEAMSDWMDEFREKHPAFVAEVLGMTDDAARAYTDTVIAEWRSAPIDRFESFVDAWSKTQTTELMETVTHAQP